MNNHPFNPVSNLSFQRPKFAFRFVRRVRFTGFTASPIFGRKLTRRRLTYVLPELFRASKPL